MKIVIIMPTYNEAENIGLMIDTLFEKEFPKIKNANMHLLIVDDNSPDGTGDIVKKKMKQHKNLHLLVGEKAGLGMAYVRGMKHAMGVLKADATLEMDSDFQHNPKHVKDLVNAYVKGADYVIGSRYVEGGSIPEGWAVYRKAISFFGNLYARLILWLPKLHDVTTGFRLTKVKGVLDKIDLDNLMELNHFAFKVDLFYQSVKLSKNTVEVPIQFAERTKEESKFSLAEMVATYKVVMFLRIRESQRFIKFAFVGFLGFIINAAGIELFRALPITQALADLSIGFANTPVLNVMTTPASWAAALGAELAIMSNYTLNNFWTFKEKKITAPVLFVRKFLEFNFTSLGAVFIQFGVIGGAVLIFSDTAIIRQLALVFSVAFLIVPYNYVVYNLFIWHTWKLPKFLRKG